MSRIRNVYLINIFFNFPEFGLLETSFQGCHILIRTNLLLQPICCLLTICCYRFMKNSKSVNKPTRTRKSKSHKGNTRITKRRPKRISKPKPLQKKRQQQQQQISIKRSSGRKEKFDTNRLAQT